MVATITHYNSFITRQLNGNAIDLDTNTIKVALVTSTYVPNQDTHDFFDDITNELAATGNYTAGGAAIGSKTVTQDDVNNGATFDGADVTWTALTPSAAFRYGIIYKDTGAAATSPLIAYIDFGANQNPGGNNFTIQWHADGIAYIR